MRSERVSTASCAELVRRWTIHPRVAAMLLAADRRIAEQFSAEGAHWPGIWVISGFRKAPVTPSLNPTEAPATQSRHLACPSLAVDVRVGNAPASTTDPGAWAVVGTAWEALGGRWGGRFNPPDWNHLDIDPSIANSG